MRIKAKARKGKITVKAMAKHPMLSYQEAEKKKKTANFITHMMGTINGKTVYDMTSTQFLSKNPYVKFYVHDTVGKKGDKITMNWVDLLGKKKSTTKKIK